MAKIEKSVEIFGQWKDCEQLFLHLGAQVKWKKSRLRVSYKGHKGLFYCSDIHSAIDQLSIDALKKFLEYVGENEI